MSDRLEVHEIRYGTEDDWETVCLCPDKTWADVVCDTLNATVAGAEAKYFINHSEIVTSVNIDIEDY